MASRKANEQEVVLLEQEMIKVIEGGIQGFREFNRHRTKFGEKFEFQETLSGRNDNAIAYIAKRLEKECKYGRRCQLLVAKETKYEPTSEVTNLSLIRQKWRKDIIESVPNDRKYGEMLFNFKHVNMSEISAQIVKKLGENGTMLDINTTLNPTYYVGAKIDRLPGMISSTRVLVSVTYDGKPQSKK